MEERSDGFEFNYLGAVLKSSAARGMSRIGVVVEAGVQSFALQIIRAAVPTYGVETLRELRIALMEQEPGGVIALDIRGISRADTALLAPCLAESSDARGLVYVMTPRQFDLFEDVAFDFVYR